MVIRAGLGVHGEKACEKGQNSGDKQNQDKSAWVLIAQKLVLGVLVQLTSFPQSSTVGSTVVNELVEYDGGSFTR